METNGYRLMVTVFGPLLDLANRTRSTLVSLIVILFMQGIVTLILIVGFLSIGWLVAVFPFWMLGAIDEVRAGSASKAFFQVFLVIAYYSILIPVFLWCIREAE